MLAHDSSSLVTYAGLCCVWLVIALSLTPTAVHSQAQWTANGVPICVVPGCSGFLPQVCGDGAGGALIAWNRNPTLTDQNIYVHRVLHNGALAPGWPPKATPATRAPGDQWLTDLVPDGQGGAFVAWFDFPNYDVYAQHVLGNGQIAPGWPVDGLPVRVAPNRQSAPRMLADGVGGVFIAWEDGGFPLEDVRVQHLNGDGTRVEGWPENGLEVCTAPESQVSPILGMDRQGGCFVAWSDGRNGIGGEIYAQRVSWFGEVAAGWPVDGRQIITDAGVYATRRIWGVVPDHTGGAYIGWGVDHGPDAFDDDVFAIRILADGSTAPGWPAAGFPVCALNNVQYLTGVASDSSGGVLLTWYDHRAGTAVAYAQRLRPDGTIAPGWQTDGTRVSDAFGYHFAPRIAPDGSGGAFVTFELDYDGARGHVQHILANGSLAPGWLSSGIPLVMRPGRQSEMTIVSDEIGGAIVAWNEYQDQVYAQRYYGLGPTPVLVSLASVQAFPDRVTLTWHDPSRAISEATVYRRREGEQWIPLGRAASDAPGRIRFEDRGVAPGERLAYRLGWMESRGEQFSSEVWIDVPLALAFGLEGARPNPAVGAFGVAFTLPNGGPATLELLDVGGRQILAREVGSLGPGRHLIQVGECGCMPPGMYWLRLTQAGYSQIQRVAVVR